MQKDSHAKTESALKSKKANVPLLIIGLSLVMVLAIGVKSTVNNCDFKIRKDTVIKSPKARLNSQISDDDSERSLGLGGRGCMSRNDSMLFTFDSESTSDRCFWMKDMQFSIDIFWLNNNKEVVDQVLGASPKDYPKIYCPKSPARYVLETSVGRLTKGESIIGERLKF